MKQPEICERQARRPLPHDLHTGTAAPSFAKGTVPLWDLYPNLAIKIAFYKDKFWCPDDNGKII